MRFYHITRHASHADDIPACEGCQNGENPRGEPGEVCYPAVATSSVLADHCRAYIAASRRSDRSLEARVESARRASEIHKRRTGRALRVTEQDVINEEMYEEEEDDLPLQYRRLTAHLQTGSVDFNRRLAAYLTNQVAMRSAMEQMVNNSYVNQFPNGAQFAQSPTSMYPPQMTQRQNLSSPNSSYRQSPYPSPYQPGFRRPHGRAFSTAQVPSNAQSASASPPSGRRLSTPASLQQNSSGTLETQNIKQDPDYQRQTQSANLGNGGNFPPLWQDMGPFTTTLPPDAQQMLAPALDPTDPFSAMLLNGSEQHISSSYYPWGNMQQGKMGELPSTYSGMASTLAPSDLDNERLSATGSRDTSLTSTSGPPGLNLDFGGQDNKLSFHGAGTTMDGANGGFTSGQITPGEGFWDSFVQDGGWSEDSTAN